MTKLRPLIYVPVLSVFACLTVCAQDQRITFEPNSVGKIAGEDPRGVLLDLKSKVLSGAFDPNATEALTMAERCTTAEFNLPTLRLERKITHRDDGGDNLLALWSFEGKGMAGSIILDDTPYFSNYVAHIASPRLRSKEEIQDFVDVLFGQEAPLRGLGPTKASVAISGISVRVAAHRSDSALANNFEFRLLGQTHEDGWYASIFFGKGLIQKCYSDPPFIPERFPSLIELVKTWSVSRLWSETANPFQSPLARQNSNQRERIIIAELGRRGLTTDEIMRLLQPDSPRGLDERNLVVTSALEGVRPGWVNDYLHAALEMYQSIGSKANLAATHLFGIAALHCSDKAESIAMQVLRDPAIGGGATGYLLRCSNSLGALAALKKMAEAGELQDSSKLAIPAMERRIQRGNVEYRRP